MARKLRVEYPGAIYHLMNRGDRRESIFKDDEDRQRYLGTLGEACVKTGWQVHAYCLMSNQSFSSGDRNSAGQSGQGNEMAFGCLHLPVQPAAQAVWPFVQRSLQEFDCGRQWQQLPAVFARTCCIGWAARSR